MNSSLPLLKFYGTSLFFRKDHINLWSVLALLSYTSASKNLFKKTLRVFSEGRHFYITSITESNCITQVIILKALWRFSFLILGKASFVRASMLMVHN